MADSAELVPLRSEQMRGAAGVIGALATTVVALVTVLGFAQGDPVLSVQRNASTWLVLLGLVGVASLTVAAWASRIEHWSVPVGVAVASAGLMVPVWAAWSWLPGALRAAVLAAAPFAVAGSAHVALRWSSQAGRSRGLGVVYLLAAAGSVVHLGGYNPFEDPACARTCVDIQPLARGVFTSRSAVAIACLLTVLAALVAALAIGRATPRAPARILAGVLAAIGLLTVSSVMKWTMWENASTADPFLVLPPVAVAVMVAVPVVVVAIDTLRTRLAMDRLITRLADPATAMRDLGGAIRVVHFAVPGDERWVDAAGRGVNEPPREDRCVVMSDESGPLLRLLLARNRNAVDVLELLTPATRMALRNAQLAAVAHARLSDVQASRRRLVAMSDTERRRIEHDLHDGAQQGLVAAAFYLSAARSRLPEADATLANAEAKVHQALAQLRRLAHGIFPSVLTTEGLHAAVDSLVSACDVPATLDLQGSDDVDADTAMAAYATVAAALDHVEPTATVTSTRVSVVHSDHVLNVSVETSGSGRTATASDFAEVADRVRAVGGQFSVWTTEIGTVVTAVVPCAP